LNLIGIGVYVVYALYSRIYQAFLALKKSLHSGQKGGH
jgi:hypothetical protein